MPALDRAFPLAEVDHVAVRVREDLDLDVPRIVEVALDVDGRVREVGGAFALSRLERRRNVGGRCDELETLAPAPCRGLDRDRPADLVADRHHRVRRVHGLGRSGDDRHVRGLHRSTGSRLVAHELDRLGWRADPDETCIPDRPCERGVLGEKPVAGVNRLGLRPLRGLDQAIDCEVALGRGWRADEERIVGHTRVQAAAVGLGVDGDRRDAELAQAPEDPHGDLATIRDEDTGERRHRAYSLREMTLADQLTVARALAVVVVVALFESDFANNELWATIVFVVAMATDQVDGWLARRQGKTSALGSVLDPVADKILVLAMLIMLVGTGVFPAWMVALIVAREFLVSGLRVAAIERGVVIPARELAKLKTWVQAIAATIGGLVAAGAWNDDVAWWSLLVALVFTWVSGIDYARAAPGLLRSRPAG